MSQQKQPESRQDIEARIISKAWKDESYKQELLSNPKAIFEQEFGVELPEEISIQVLEENSTTLNFVLPMHPETSGHELNESELEAIAGGKGVQLEIAKESIKVSLAGIFTVATFNVTTE